DRRAQPLGDLLQLGAGAARPLSGEDGGLALAGEKLSGALDEVTLGHAPRRLKRAARMAGHVALEAALGLGGLGLDVDGDADMRYGAVGERGAAGEIDHVLDMRRPHDALIEQSDILVEVVLVHVLEITGADQIVIGHAGDGENRRAVDLGVIKPVEEMHRARPRGREADAEAAGELGVAASRQGSGLLVPRMDVADAILRLAQRLDEAVDAVAGQAEDRIHAPIEQVRYYNVGNGLCHGCTPERPARERRAGRQATVDGIRGGAAACRPREPSPPRLACALSRPRSTPRSGRPARRRSSGPNSHSEAARSPAPKAR